ncbi:MAG: FimB/Mfa2 family fimbrial subunit [Clostridium sp.]|nr:FimB/Mfa2 family fimbrial subunit [Clostridium sp.]
MKVRFNNIVRKCLAAATIVLAAASLGSCSMINDDLPECHQGVELRFVYDYNMEFANAFPSQVDCLTLLVYDAEGKYVTSRTEASSLLKDENYRMTLDLAPGNYTFVAYGGMECREASFHFVDTPGADVPLSDNKVEINANCLTAPVGTELHPLFYGRLDMEVPDRWQSYTKATVEMMKDTNNLRVILQQVNGEVLTDDMFDFKVVDDNRLMAWNNDVIPTSPYEYMPWTRGNATVGELSKEASLPKLLSTKTAPEPATVCFAEFSFPRLVMSNSPTLMITQRSSGKEIVNIPLINYLLLVKSASLKMDDQEFLDRESRWTLFFFLDRSLNWFQVQIQVQNWTVRINRASV